MRQPYNIELTKIRSDIYVGFYQSAVNRHLLPDSDCSSWCCDLCGNQAGAQKAREISKQFLSEHPDAATLYIYGEDLPSNSAELDCIQGTVSKVYDPRTVFDTKVQKGVACHVLPGTVELNVKITWSKSYYVARKHGSMQAHFRFEAVPGYSYAAVFNVKDSKAQIISLDAQ